jgi:hypothetical protein
MGNFNKTNIDFARQSLLGKSGRPSPAIVLYPRNTSNTKLEVQILSDATTLSIKYTSTTAVTKIITYANKSVSQVVQEINQLNFPIKAVSLGEFDILRQGDLISPSTSFVSIPLSFSVYDRVDGNGVLLRSKKIAVQHKGTSNIKVLTPYSEDRSLPWYPRILNGSFSQKYNGKLYHFYIPEFDSQSWSTLYGKPFKDVIGTTPSLVEKGVYRLPRFPIYWNGQNITIYNEDVPLSNSIIQDIDINNGILYLDPSFEAQSEFTIDYVYLENSYIYKDININGHFTQNPLMLDKFVVIYMVPVEATTVANKKTIKHVVGDSIESAIDSIVVEDSTIPIAIIGAYSIQSIPASDQVNILDTRSKGGGLRKSSGPTSVKYPIDNPILPDTVEIENIYADSYRFWDIGHIDGESYPAAAAVSVELPDHLREILDITEIKKKTSKFIAAGVYPSISFYSRELPAVTGLSRQVSCVYNTDLSNIFTKSISGGGVASTIPGSFTGAGWGLLELKYPGSIFSGVWTSFSPTIPVKKVDNYYVIEVDTYTGVGFTYLKSIPDAGISWSERTVVYNTGITDAQVEYSAWETKTFIDTKEVNTGELNKSYFYINPENVTKQYTDFKVNSPYHLSNITNKVETAITSTIDNILELQIVGYGSDNDSKFNTAVKYTYSDVLNKTTKSEIGNYIFSPYVYSSLFKLGNTPLETKYFDSIKQIGEDTITNGVYSSGHYFKFFLQGVDSYFSIPDGGPSTVFQFNNQLKDLNRYLNFRVRNNIWNSLCDTGASASTGLVTKLLSSDIVFGSFGTAIPTYWAYFPTNTASGITQDYFSGYYITSASGLGSTVSEVLESKNYDFLYTDSLPAVTSCVLASTGKSIISNDTLNGLSKAYTLAVNNVVNNVNEAINGVRYYSGSPTTSHWFVGHNRLGSYLGRNLSNLTETYDILYEYNKNRGSNYDITVPSAAGPNYLNYVFSGIENILETSYDTVYNNLLRMGVVEPEIADTISAYGWYVTNWYKNYGTRGKTYSIDNRPKYYSLFSDGLKQVIKNTITDEGKFLEIKTIQGEAGAFSSETPTKILYPLARALKINKEEWEGVAEGVVTSVLNNYFVSGFYYTDPYKVSTQAGKEYTLLDGLVSVYQALANTGADTLFEPVFTGFSNLRGAKFSPNFNSYNTVPPTGDWQGTVNSLAFWKYYNSGDVEKAITNLKSIGLNCLSVDLDYILWKVNSGQFYNRLDHFVNTCVDNRISVIPTFFNDAGETVSQANFTNYVNSFGHTGKQYRSEATDSFHLMTGVLSGSNYILNTVQRYDNSPSIIAWNVVSNPVANGNNIMNYNAAAYLIDTTTTTDIMYSLGSSPSRGDINGLWDPGGDSVPDPLPESKYGLTSVIYPADVHARMAPIYNPRYNFIGISPNPIFDYFIGTLPSISKKYILNDYGDGAYGDYTLAVSNAYYRNLPIIFSDLYVKSGSYKGTIYDNLECRISRHLVSIKAFAQAQYIESTGVPVQVKDFTNKYFYESDYIPSYNGRNLIFDINNWNLRPSKTPLQDYNTGEFKKQAAILKVLQSGLDTLNDSYYPDYFNSFILSTEEKQNLNFYRSEWTSADFISNPSNVWTLSGNIDSKKYDTFITNWGLTLREICRRLNING